MAIDLSKLQSQFSPKVIPSVDWSIFYFFLVTLTVLLANLGVTYLIIKLLLAYKLHKTKHVFLEIKPLKKTELNPYSTEQLFNLFHSITSQKTFLERMFGVSKSISLEIVSTKTDGIKYVIRTPHQLASLIKNSLLSYLPGIEISTASEYLHDNPNTFTAQLKLSKHFAFPLKAHDNLETNDPIAYLTGAMTKLKEGELLAYQVMISPISKSKLPEIKRLQKLITNKQDLTAEIAHAHTAAWLYVGISYLLQILLLPLGILVFLATDGKDGPLLPIPRILKGKETSNAYQSEIETLVKKKIDQPLYRASIRILSQSYSQSTAKKRSRGFMSTLRSISGTQYQHLTQSLRLPIIQINTFKTFLFKRRISLPFSNSILSSSELGDLYHFPFTKTTKTEDMQKQFSKELPAPLSLKKGNKLDVVFAQNTYANSKTLIGLSEDERRRHMYILGATGTGKSTMLLSMISSDIQNGKGLAVVDPHGDLIEQILHVIPKGRIQDVVYFNPDDIEYPMGINLLELSEGLREEDTTREKEYIAESIISLFHKIYTEKYSGPRMEYILRNTIHTAFTVPGATLFTVYKLLINTEFRKSVVKNLTDENLKDFWKFEFAKAGDYQKVKMISPITNKIGRFLFSPTAKRILEQEKSTINFEQIMNEGKILLCNLSKGKLGEDNSKVFGVVVMAKLQLASLRRARMAEKDRKDFYMYVDEFQNFATPAFAQILSEARKYRLGAILAHQTTSQLEDKSLVNVTLANTGTVICFRTANPEDESAILPQFRPYVEQGDIAGLPSYRFFMRLGALNPEEPFSGITMPVEIGENKKMVSAVVESSRSRYAMKYAPPKRLESYQYQPKVKKVIKPKQSVGYSALP
ncbi:MAG: ATP-binding protein [Candidatus Pacebacteria bacterium]|nr:ATP-binding protein [Candidatus Paceibacterota bacterium]PIR63239.1 MAG: hypothetical protein COU64_05990 [Candidatus Pacebacteria bacterium CG10_big_fil_rev_8_21_14_0_10_40_26]PIZ78270.1 MAG: hypothetical protein COY01_05810 [Candidatus Pacebacteria bacterium CG_4_10_14_0_2_um_filter_40_20]PJA68685.1 MAG: hypothetical protein CO156_04235 [Candidatus Pacebacteria bacterium CG_4_9_14_3_um_filter_40_12]PJC41625.1 MAG: hypothetical protein CO041_02825 [Candidatus Pacebacteria bacterium CG_4_9_1